MNIKQNIKKALEGARVHISRGNMKVGSIPNFSLTPGRTCSREACGTCLREGCYAMKAYRQYPGTRKAWDENSDAAEQNIPALENALELYFTAKKPEWFRLHVGGDFASREYASMWARIASRHPGTRFLAFTKQWEMVRGVEFPDNFSLVLSGWPGTEIPADLRAKYSAAMCIEHAEDMPDGGFLCPGSCESCHACWSLARRGIDVYFVKH